MTDLVLTFCEAGELAVNTCVDTLATLNDYFVALEPSYLLV